MVRVMGLEPTRPIEHKHLKLACLPIPAHSQMSPSTGDLFIISFCSILSRAFPNFFILASCNMYFDRWDLSKYRVGSRPRRYEGTSALIVIAFWVMVPVITTWVKGLFLPEKVLFKTGRIHGFSNRNAADDAEAVWRSHKKKSAKNYSLDRQTTSSQIGENTGVKRNCFLKNL